MCLGICSTGSPSFYSDFYCSGFDGARCSAGYGAAWGCSSCFSTGDSSTTEAGSETGKIAWDIYFVLFANIWIGFGFSPFSSNLYFFFISFFYLFYVLASSISLAWLDACSCSCRILRLKSTWFGKYLTAHSPQSLKLVVWLPKALLIIRLYIMELLWKLMKTLYLIAHFGIYSSVLRMIHSSSGLKQSE